MWDLRRRAFISTLSALQEGLKPHRPVLISDADYDWAPVAAAAAGLTPAPYALSRHPTSDLTEPPREPRERVATPACFYERPGGGVGTAADV